MSTTTKRLTILNDSEIEAIYALPQFNPAERAEYFYLDDAAQSAVDKLRRFDTKVYFILSLGYFRARPTMRHFHFKNVQDDLAYVCETYFPGKKCPRGKLPATTKTTLFKKVLAVTGFCSLDQRKHKSKLLARIRDTATICVDPPYVFDECLAYCRQNHIALPGYTTLQDMVSDVLVEERERIERTMNRSLSELTRARLRKILDTKGVISHLAQIKSVAKDFSESEISRELDTHATIKEIYPELKVFIEKLKLSQGNLSYYASLVRHRSVTKLRRYTDGQGLMFLACYLYFRYQETNDNLVDAFVYLERKFREAAKSFAKQGITDDLEVIRAKLKSAASLLRFYVDDEISDDVPFGDVRKGAFQLLSRRDIHLISNHIDETGFDMADYVWQYVDTHATRITRALRRIFCAIDIDCEPANAALSKQITEAQHVLSTTGRLSSLDQRLILKRDRPYLLDVEDEKPKRLEIYLYQRVAQKLRNNELFVTESAGNRKLEDDLIPNKDWENKDHLLRKTGLEKATAPIQETLDAMVAELNRRLQAVCDNITDGKNPYVSLAGGDDPLKWSIAHRKWRETADNPIYNQLQHMGIEELMTYVNSKTNYLDAFTNIGLTKGKTPDAEDLIACIFANGANYSLLKMANISDRHLGVLRSVCDSHIRPETLAAANDRISSATAALPIFRFYDIGDDRLFASIDGQKHECRINTFKARYSAKYFRQGKGLTAMNLISNHVPLNTRMIGANEYEGHFAFDLLYNNTSDIQPDVLSSDSHGVNSVNFALLDLFGYTFAPRYAKVKKVFFDHFTVNTDQDIFIQLNKPINTELIIQEWDGIQRIICSLSRKTVDQSTIVKKLSNRRTADKTLRALQEYDRLVKSLYLLEYVDNETLRRYIQQALNRGEAYHQLRRAVASINGNRFRGGSDYQITQWNDCARLVCNCIIYYNSALFSVLLKSFEERGDKKSIDFLTDLSPVGWQHIGLTGRYSFGEEEKRFEIDLSALLDQIDPFDHRAMDLSEEAYAA